MPDLWFPGATRMDIGNHAPMDGGPAKAGAHITWDRNATAAAPADLVSYETLQQYFGRNPSGMSMAPHLLWDPFTGRVTQFLPVNSRALALADTAGGTRTNRAGSVLIQFEALFFPYCRWNGRVYPRLVDTPCKGWPELLAWVRSWGVPDRWPMGRPTDFTSRRSEQVWETQGGWYAHAHVPENNHQDPGSWPDFSMEDDVTPQDVQDIAEAVWAKRIGQPDGGDVAAGTIMSYLDQVQINTRQSVKDDLAAAVEELKGAMSAPAPVDAEAVAAALTADSGFADMLTEKLADKLADRLKA